MPRLAPLVGRVAGLGAGAWGVQREASRLRDAGHDVIVLTIADPDQRTPEPVVEATVAALRRGRTGYGPMVGSAPLRAAIAARIERRSGRACAADNVVVTPGAQGGLYCALQCITGPGDEVIAPEPLYATYPAVVGASGATLVTIPSRAERAFHPDLADIAAAVTPRTRAIWINSPHNPTGVVLSAEEIDGIAEICRRHDLWLVSDEVYEDLAFVRPHVSAWSLPDMAERTVLVSSLSKSHAMPGFRLGWIAGPESLSRHFFDLLLCMTYGAPPFIQDGALAAFESELPGAAEMREVYRARAAMMSVILAAAPRCRAIPPEGGMFVLLDIRGTGLSGEAFARGLLAAERVAVLPCDGFGPSAAGHLRIALTAPQPRLEEAGNRIVAFARNLARGS